MDSPTSATDERDILRIANEVIEQLNISCFRPVTVSWAEDVPWTFVDSEKPMPELAGALSNEMSRSAGVFSVGTQSFYPLR